MRELGELHEFSSCQGTIDFQGVDRPAFISGGGSHDLEDVREVQASDSLSRSLLFELRADRAKGNRRA